MLLGLFVARESGVLIKGTVITSRGQNQNLWHEEKLSENPRCGEKRAPPKDRYRWLYLDAEVLTLPPVFFLETLCLCAADPSSSPNTRPPYMLMLHTRNEEDNTVFYSDLACFVYTFTLNMYVSMSYTGLHRRNTLFVFVWLRHRNT